MSTAHPRRCALGAICSEAVERQGTSESGMLSRLVFKPSTLRNAIPTC
jgi:hypothetical protein